jgi:hypothetical protein
MKKLDEQVLKIAKEIVAKFIEVGRVSPTTFDEAFKSVYKSVIQKRLQECQRSRSGIRFGRR